MLQMEKDYKNIFDLIEKHLGEECLWLKYKQDLPLLYSANFNLVECMTRSKRFVLIIPKLPDLPIELIRGIYSQIELNPCFYLENSFLSDQASRFNIPHFDSKGIFHNKSVVKADKYLAYTKTTQLLIKYLLLSKNKGLSTRQIANVLDVSNTSIQRAYDFLEVEGAVIRKGFYTSTVSYFISRKKLLECLKKNMINPIKNSLKMFIKSGIIKTLEDKLYHGAEAVLSNNTDLDESFIEEFATDSETFNKLVNNLEKYESNNGDFVTIEEWIYKIDYFSSDRFIDIVDAYIILSKRYENTDDPRISSGLKELERKLLSGKD